MNQGRLQSFDLLKLFAIFLVLWGHCVQYLLSSNHIDEPVYRFIYSFHMPLFMMIAGMFASRSLQMPLGAFVWKKAEQLILPCVVWGMLMTIGNIAQPLLTGRAVETSVLTTLFTGNFWFLKSLFGCYLLAYIGQNLLRNKWLFYTITIVISQFITEYSILWMYPAFVVGIELSNHFDQLQKHSGKIAIVSASLFFLLTLACGNDMRTIDNAILFRLCKILTGWAGSLALIALALLWERRGAPHIQWISQWGGYTMGVYILQCIVFIVQSRFLHICFDSLNPLLFNAAIAPLLALLLTVGCLFGVWVLRQNRYTAYLLLGIKSSAR